MPRELSRAGKKPEMIELRQGNLFNSGAEAIVNPVNCVGVMGRGLALEFKERFPANFKAYQAACKSGRLRPGHLLVHSQTGDVKFIINFPTKDHWRGASKMSYIVDGLQALTEQLSAHQIASVAIPPIGCGLGGLAWPEVLEQIKKTFQPLAGLKVFVYKPAIDLD